MHQSQYTLHPETPELVLRSVFLKYDKDGSKQLNEKEFSFALSDLGIIDQHEQLAIFHLADADNGGTVDIQEFITLIKGHELDVILSNHDSLEFIYQTFNEFQKYDADGNGDISWDEFYFYLTNQGYSHQMISQYWHYLDEDKSASITFPEFWKGYKLMAETQHQQQQESAVESAEVATLQDFDSAEYKSASELGKKKKHSSAVKTLKGLQHLRFSNRADSSSNLLVAARAKLAPSEHKMNKHDEYSPQLGRVISDDHFRKAADDIAQAKRQKDADSDGFVYVDDDEKHALDTATESKPETDEQTKSDQKTETNAKSARKAEKETKRTENQRKIVDKAAKAQTAKTTRSRPTAETNGKDKTKRVSVKKEDKAKAKRTDKSKSTNKTQSASQKKGNSKTNGKMAVSAKDKTNGASVKKEDKVKAKSADKSKSGKKTQSASKKKANSKTNGKITASAKSKTKTAVKSESVKKEKSQSNKKAKNATKDKQLSGHD
eukprot:CAMPEP_0197035580 /NCGR_PEP_ID=MMETSP1384-20130603/13333_1 /TAXON_ID=29189 /ORGANISM="Ammonia sp." /LENGTH=491 /DNA_ID=CAMNT_0042465659 /DNA_START=64 /DNA_END=1539 /DNA_ORIENTATION=-